jgi:hypothetical protein
LWRKINELNSDILTIASDVLEERRDAKNYTLNVIFLFFFTPGPTTTKFPKDYV